MLALLIMFSRTLSTPVCEAASISIISSPAFLEISLQTSHSLHGSEVLSCLFLQLTDLESMRARVVLPTALGPQKR